MPFDRSIIDRYAAQSAEVRAAVAGLSREELLAFPIPGTWSIQQVIIHIQDSDLIGIDRMKRIIAQSNPLIIGYDETAFTQSLACDKQSIDDALMIFEVARRQFAVVLHTLPDAAFERTGIHSERGKIRLADQVQGYVDHVAHHLRFVRAKLEKLKGGVR